MNSICNILNVFGVTFDEFSASWLKKIWIILMKKISYVPEV